MYHRSDLGRSQVHTAHCVCYCWSVGTLYILCGYTAQVYTSKTHVSNGVPGKQINTTTVRRYHSRAVVECDGTKSTQKKKSSSFFLRTSYV